MPFNGSGGFTVYVPGNPVITGTVISSTAFNNTMGDFALGLSNCVTADGQTAIGVPIKFYAGTVTLPGIAFGAAPGNGLYLTGSNTIGVSVAGTKVLDIASGALSVTGNIINTGFVAVGSGDAGSPNLRFAGDTDTGIFQSSSNMLGLSTGGISRLDVSSTALHAYSVIWSDAGGGLPATPSYSFYLDDDTGMYRINANNVGISCGGTNALDIAAGGIGVAGQASSASTALATPASTTAISSMRLPHGAAPTNPVNGDMWTTTAGLFVRINGVTVGPLS